MTALTFALESVDPTGARRGAITTSHGVIPTPAFMPVGTRATVRSLSSQDLTEVGTDVVLSNTYHLMLRPGAELIEEFGGLHGFMSWDGPILTDSGGYQIFSLNPKITEEGAAFRSTYDGASVMLTPEEAVRIQQLLGPDIAMVLDVCVGLPADRHTVSAAMQRTLRWAERSRDAHDRDDQALFGIIQGGVDPELRAQSARETAALGFDGFGIGGLSVGEPAPERNLALEAAVAELPDGQVRYVMGLGDTDGMLDAVARGADLFDCVLPTRLARHGKVLSKAGDFNLRRAENRTNQSPLEDGCGCSTCQRYSRGYLRHLLVTGELTVSRLVSIHNLTYTLDLLREARDAIAGGEFGAFYRDRHRGREPQ